MESIMIYTYGFSLTGTSHIKKNVGCQDAHKIKKLENGWVIAATADGVGSAKHSAIGSKIAVETTVDSCEKSMLSDHNTDNIKSVITDAYKCALESIVHEAEKSGNRIEEYDTTLDLVIYNGTTIIYGHSGDGGIIGLTTFGEYVSITSPQKGIDYISVMPLRAGPGSWEIDRYEAELSTVLMVTDGMWDILKPYLLAREKNNIYVPIVFLLSDFNCYKNEDDPEVVINNSIEAFLNNEMDEECFYQRMSAGLKQYFEEKSVTNIIKSISAYNYPFALMNSVTDDKTVVGVMNGENIPQANDPAYYKEPDWKKLQEDWNRLAYPHLYAEDQAINDNKLNELDDEAESDVTSEKLQNNVIDANQSSTEATSTDDSSIHSSDNSIPIAGKEEKKYI